MSEADLGSCERGGGGGGGGRARRTKIQLGGLGERCKLPQRVLGRSPSRQPISCSLEKIVTFDVCIVEFWNFWSSEPRLVARALAERGGGGGGGEGGEACAAYAPLTSAPEWQA